MKVGVFIYMLLAGIMIAIAAMCNLALGGLAGAVCFAIGLCAIC